jgi:hypothetical protein
MTSGTAGGDYVSSPTWLLVHQQARVAKGGAIFRAGSVVTFSRTGGNS